jgi:transposase
MHDQGTEPTAVSGPTVVFGGVDTHRDTVHAAVCDALGRVLADAEFPASVAGYRRLLAWMRRHGQLAAVGVEGTGSYGAGLSRFLRAADVTVLEINRPDRRARRAQGKSDPLDSIAAARATASGTVTVVPKHGDGPVEAIRVLHATYRSAVKARTQAINQLRALIVTAPDDLRQRLSGLSTTALSTACARLRPAGGDAISAAATKTAMRTLARRITALTAEADDLRGQLRALVHTTAPTLLDLLGVGVDTAATLLTAAGDNPDRIRSDGSFAHLCGAAPLPASSGRTDRHRLNRGGNRDANSALHIIAVVRLRHCRRTRDYTTRRTTQGLSKKDILRCLKRYIARDVRTAILTDLPGHTPQPTRHHQAP